MSQFIKEMMKEPKGRKPESAPDTIYARVQKSWDDRLGSVVKRAANWRMAFFISSGIASICAIGLVIVAIRPPLPPLVIAVDKMTGAANVVGRLNAQTYEPQKIEIQYFLGHFVKLVRPIPIDGVVLKQNWGQAKYFLRETANNELEQSARSDGHHAPDKIGSEAISVELISINFVSGSDSYQARWKETVYGADGVVKESYVMLGVFTIEIEPPKDEQTVLYNPLGIYIKHMEWSKEVVEKSNIPSR
ncbi:MAG: conjugal transfer protein TrbF [Pseudomonadota bacterium]